MHRFYLLCTQRLRSLSQGEGEHQIKAVHFLMHFTLIYPHISA